MVPLHFRYIIFETTNITCHLRLQKGSLSKKNLIFRQVALNRSLQIDHVQNSIPKTVWVDCTPKQCFLIRKNLNKKINTFGNKLKIEIN